MAIDLDMTLALRRASIYANPLDPEALLPRVFGNYLDPNALPTDAHDGGFTPAVCVDRINLIYVITDGPAVSTPPQIFWNGQPQPNSVAVWNPANNLEGHGIVATLQFTLRSVLDGEVAVRFGGSVDGNGVPITNPIIGLYHTFTQYAGWTLANFDLGTCQRSVYDMDALGYPFYWVFQEEKTLGEWLSEILPQYHAEFTETGEGQLAIIVDRTLTTFTVTPDYHIRAYEIEDNGSPAQAIRFEAHADDVANQVTLHARHNWVTGESTISYTQDFLQSQSAYQAVYPVPFTFRGMYTPTHAISWLNSFFMRHGFEPRTANFVMRGLRGLTLIPPRVITVEWPLYHWERHLLKVRKVVPSFRNRQVQFECVDCQRELSDEVTSMTASPAQRRQQLGRVYSWVPGTVGTGGSLADAPPNPKNETANGNFENGNDGSWDLQNLWMMVENPTLAYDGRWFAQHVPNMGNAFIAGLRVRIDPGEWVLISGQFASAGGANGQGMVAIGFYDIDDVQLSSTIGSAVPPTTTYLESVLFMQAPAGVHYYRPSIGLTPYPTVGTWRADHVFSASGSRVEVLSKRNAGLTTRNLIFNGDYEVGDAGYIKDPGWIITNDPAYPSRSGIWKAVHLPETTPSVNRLIRSMTDMPVTEGDLFTARWWVRTVGTITGLANVGIYWLDGNGAIIGQLVAIPDPGPYPTVFVMGTGQVEAPAGAVYASFFAATFNHTGAPGSSAWVFEDLFAQVSIA